MVKVPREFLLGLLSLLVFLTFFFFEAKGTLKIVDYANEIKIEHI